MERKIVKYGNHVIGDNVNGYMYSFNSSQSYNFDSHIHFCYEFVHVLKGNLLYTVENSDYILSEGDIIITNPDELHSFSFPQKCLYEREFLHIYPGFLNQFPDILNLLNSRTNGKFNLLPSYLAKEYCLDKIFENMYIACKNSDMLTHSLMLAYSSELIIQIARLLQNEIIKYTPPTLNKKSNDIQKYIDRNYRRNISVPDIAEAMYMSTAYASRLFKKETGMTIKAYLNLRRITNAKNLIMEGRKATEIYGKCGFENYSTFYRSFIKFVGMSPDDYKAVSSGKRR